MIRRLLLAALLATLVSSNATAASRPLLLSGDNRPRHYAWIDQAAQNVPIPAGHYWLFSGFDPEYDPSEKMILLPQPGKQGWTYQAEHYLLLHELGHVFDAEYLSPLERAEFKQAIESPCSWWSKRCKPPRNPGLSVPPGERFAELYAACALGLTRWQADSDGYPSYGWDPPAGHDDRSLCQLIWEFAV